MEGAGRSGSGASSGASELQSQVKRVDNIRVILLGCDEARVFLDFGSDREQPR